MIKTRVLPVVAAVLMTAGISGCGGGSEKDSADKPSGSLSFAVVQKETPEKDFIDKCPYGGWSDNSTGVDEKYRKGVKFFRQYDCYKKPVKEATGLGDLSYLQVVEYVEFDTAAHAQAYVDGNLDFASKAHLVDSTKVVSMGMGFGSGMSDAEMKAFLAKIHDACGCGETKVGKDS